MRCCSISLILALDSRLSTLDFPMSPIICFLSGALGVLAMFILIAFSPEIGDFLSRFKR